MVLDCARLVLEFAVVEFGYFLAANKFVNDDDSLKWLSLIQVRFSFIMDIYVVLYMINGKR